MKKVLLVLLVVLITFLITWIVFGITCFLVTPGMSVIECMTYQPVLVLLTTLSWIPCLKIGYEYSEIID
jgi:hypothetical protein